MKKHMIFLGIVQIVLGMAFILIGALNIFQKEYEKEIEFLKTNHNIPLEGFVNLTDDRTGETKRMSGVEYWDRLMK